MKTVLNLIIFVLQGATTFVMLIVIYMTFVLMDYQGGIDSFVGTTLLQPIIGGVLSIVTMATCLLLGLPIRLSNRLNSWWAERFWLSALGTLFGLFLLAISLLPSMRETVQVTGESVIMEKQIPNIGAATTGWFLAAFSVLHGFPPNRFMLWAEEVIRMAVKRPKSADNTGK